MKYCRRTFQHVTALLIIIIFEAGVQFWLICIVLAERFGLDSGTAVEWSVYSIQK